MNLSGQWGRTLEPGLRKILLDNYNALPEQFSKVFNVDNSTKAMETDIRIGGFGLFNKKQSAGAVEMEDLNDPVLIHYVHEEFAKGFAVERKMVADKQYNIIEKMPKKLGLAARRTVETVAWSVFNNAFSKNGFDGVPLISNAHKRLDNGTMSNRLESLYGGTLNGALSDKNLKAAMTQMRKQVDDKGQLIQVMPKLLIVPPALEFTAKTIVQSAFLSATGKGSGMTNDKNVIQDKLEVFVADYLTSDTAWFLLDPQTADLNFFWRNKLELESDRDRSTHQHIYQAYMRFSCGYSDYRGILGSDGSGAA